MKLVRANLAEVKEKMFYNIFACFLEAFGCLAFFAKN
jgi:hypothetical protein